MANPEDSRGEARRALPLTLAVIAALAYPLTWPFGADDFPLSSFPMFASGRDEPILSLAHALGVSADGIRRPLPPEVTGNGTVMQSAGTIQRAVAEQRAAAYCAHTAARAANAALGAVAVEIATSRYDVVGYFTNHPTPLDRVVHARCEVPVKR
jgi:hypothetical protein